MPSAIGEAMSPIKDKLYTLGAAMDESRMESVLAPMLRARFGSHVMVHGVQIEVLRRRNQRCVLRYQVNGFDAAAARDIKWRLIGKVFKANRGEVIFQYMKRLWDNGFSRDMNDGISMPEAYDFSTPLCMLFQEEVPGLPIKSLLKQAPQTAHFRQLARTLAKLHKCPIVPGKAFSIKDHLTRCHPRHEFLALACPDLAPSIDYIVRRAFELEKSSGKISLAPLHGDFHMGQVHLQDGHTWLIDFDALCYGDPASDLGNLLVFLEAKARREADVRQVIEAFWDEYFKWMDHGIAARVPLYEALTHLRRACKCLRTQDEGWQNRIERMIQRGVVCIDKMDRHDFSAAAASPWAESDGDESLDEMVLEAIDED